MIRQARLPKAAWPSERELADELPIEAEPMQARRILAQVPLWFHTFSLNRAHRLYTPGKARDHGYRSAAIPDSFAGKRVLDVGSFDGFYAFLAERRGAERVLAVDNEQYTHWVKERWGVVLAGGEGFRAIHELLGSRVEYRRLDAFALGSLEEEFDFIYCFGLLHRVENPLGLLRLLSSLLAEEGEILVETYGLRDEAHSGEGTISVPAPGAIYPGDSFVYWQFTHGALARLAAFAGERSFELHSAPLVDGHPRILGSIR